MDNLSHSLIGLIAGESVALTMPGREPGLPPQTWRGLLVTVCVVGGNLPDLDLLYSYHGFSHSTSSKLAYMLEHRGYTHTVVGCLVLALLLYATVVVWARWQRVILSPRARATLAGTSLFAILLHLAMDFLNSYGVHPFWPLENRWYYGDSVFIVEPLYWAAAAPLLFVVRSVLARVVIGVALVAAVALCLISQRVTPSWCAGLIVLMLALLFVGGRASARAAAMTGAAVMLAVTAMFIAGGAVAAHRAEAIAAHAFPSGRLLDHILTPAPMNPLCWDVLLLQVNGDVYTARMGVLSTAPAVMPAQRCPKTSRQQPMAAAAANETREVLWLGERKMSRALLTGLVAANCDAAALMRFVRAPFAARLGRDWVMGDLRFDGKRGGGMATIELSPSTRQGCRQSAPWTPPRADLLNQGDGAPSR